MSDQSCQFDPTSVSDEWWRTSDLPERLDFAPFSCELPAHTGGVCNHHREERRKSLSAVSAEIQEQQYTDFGYFDDVDFSTLDLSGCVFRCCSFVNADLSEANLNHTDFINCLLTEADLSAQSLRDVEFTNCDLSRADLERGQLVRVTFEDCDANRVDFARCRFTDTCEIQNTKFHAADLTGLTVEQDIIEGYRSPYDDDDQIKAARDYRAWSQVASDNGFPDISRTLYINHKAAKRKSQSGFKRFQAEISRGVIRYGEGILNISGASILVILGSAASYYLTGRVVQGGAEPVCQTKIDCLYISVATFVRLGFAGIESPSSLVQSITIIESLLGTGLAALFIFVIGRRATR